MPTAVGSFVAEMAFTRLSLVLALFCGIASASWGPSNLRGNVEVSKGDFVDLYIQWNAGACPIADFRLFTQALGQERVREAFTTDTHFTAENKEFWTNYTVTLETFFCFVETPLEIQISTGPGNPHKVSGIEAVPTAVDANITVAEAVMPRLVDQYNVTWCATQGECQNEILPRDPQEAQDQFNFELRALRPNTRYQLTVVPEIVFEGETYRGPEFLTEFSTEDVEVPVPTGVNATLVWDEKDHQEVNLTWTIDSSRFPLAFFNVTVLSDSDSSFVRTQTVEEPEAFFTDMPVSADLTAEVTAVYNISEQLFHKDPAILRFRTPTAEVRPVNFEFVGLSPKSIYATWDTSLEVLPNSMMFNLACSAPNVVPFNARTTEKRILLEKLAPNTTYKVLISIVDDPHTKDVLEGNFTTLGKDYAAPENVEFTLMPGDSSTASYNVTWTAVAEPEEASSFQIDYCNHDTKACDRNSTTDTHVVLPFDYFANYDVTVTAFYSLDLNRTEVRHGKATSLRTAGTEPSEVTNVTLKSVTASEAVLVWTAPANLPGNLSKMYKVFDANNNVANQTMKEEIEITQLHPYNLYNITIQASVIFGREYPGEETSILFYTDSSTPGAPKSVDVEQIPRTNVFKVHWSEPEEKNGLLDYYEVITQDATGELVSALTNLVGTNGVTVTLPSAHSDANYTVSVRAVNVNLKNETLPGNWSTDPDFSFKGIDPPTAEVVKRSRDSLTFKVSPSNATDDLDGLFFTLKHGNRSFHSSDDHFELTNLTTYTEETVHVYACYLPTFCSEPFITTELTNVGGPTPVNDLKGNFVNKTIPFVEWTAPTTLNGPLDGYILNLRDLTNASVDINEILPANQTYYVYETTMEFEKYNFTVSGFNNDLDEKDARVIGELSSTLVKTTGDHAPKPENVHEVNKTSTSVSFEWEKPEYPGFDVTYYHIEVPTMNKEFFTNETTFTLLGLKPWTNTTVLTSGCTTDNVTSCGFPGSYLASTRVDKPSEPLSIAVGDVTETEASVSWRAPSVPNGPITGYRIAVSQSDGQNLTWSEVEESIAAHKLYNLTASTKYTVHVLAYNVDDETSEEFPSAASTADFTTAGPGGFSWWIIAVALIVVVAAVAAGVVLYRRRNAQRGDREQLVQS